jgi:hypothetical protein
MTARRICRTPQESFEAGWNDGADGPPLTPEQRTRIAALLRPYISAPSDDPAVVLHLGEPYETQDGGR